MRHRVSRVLAVAVPLVLLFSLASAGEASAASCSASGSTTLAHHGDLRIYRVGQGVWVCSTFFGKHIRLSAHATQVNLFVRPSRRTFAYAIAEGGPSGLFASRDLKTGALLHAHRPSAETAVTADRLVALGDGAIAYIYSWVGSNSHDAGDTVEKVDKHGFGTLDSDCVLCGNSIDTSFLRIVGGTVEWKDNSAIRTAPFR
jgi:hypothetical protein